MKIHIQRVYRNGKETKGILQLYGYNNIEIFKCYTEELPLKVGAPKGSCILAGKYRGIKRRATFGMPYEFIELLGVKNRKDIYIKVLSITPDEDGSIGLAERNITYIENKEYNITTSWETLQRLLNIIPQVIEVTVSNI